MRSRAEDELIHLLIPAGLAFRLLIIFSRPLGAFDTFQRNYTSFALAFFVNFRISMGVELCKPWLSLSNSSIITVCHGLDEP
jgi:hypothetical protein